MIRKLLTTLLIAYVIISCSKTTPQAEGTLIKPEVTIYQYGTHAIENNSKITFALKSDIINLDNYINKKVIVKGQKVEGYPVDFGPDYLNVIKVNKISSE